MLGARNEGCQFRMCGHGCASGDKPVTLGCSVVVFAGEIVECMQSNPLESPYLLSVRPLAVVAGQQSRLVVSGLNLTRAVTRYVTCTVVRCKHPCTACIVWHMLGYSGNDERMVREGHMV